MSLQFTVFAGTIERGPRKGEPCEPEPQGSARAFVLPGGKYPIVTTDNPDLKRWRKFVASAAEAALFELPGVYKGFESPVRVELAFFMLRPKKRKNDQYHVTRPDLDKLCRGVLDGLKEGGVFKDDSQVCSLNAWKFYGFPARCEVSVSPLGEETALPHGTAREDSPSAPRSRNASGHLPASDSRLLAAPGKLFEQ